MIELNHYYGDVIDTKPDRTKVFCFQNIKGIPRYDNHKLEALRKNIPKQNIDMLYLVKINLNLTSDNAYRNYKRNI